MEKKKERLVAAIKNGTVIDHIPAGKDLSRSFPARTFRHQDRSDYRYQLRLNESGKEGNHQGVG